MRDSSTVRKQNLLVRVALTAYFFICFILTNTQLNCAVTHPIFNCNSKVILAPLAGLETECRRSFCHFPGLFFHCYRSVAFGAHSIMIRCSVIMIERVMSSVVTSCVFRCGAFSMHISNPNLLLRKLNFRGVSVLFAGYAHKFMW